MKVKRIRKISELDRDLDLTEWTSYKGLLYRHQGKFGYSIKLKPNILYGPITVKPEPLPSSTATFSHEFKPNKLAKKLSREVKITALLKDEENNWSKSLVLVPESRMKKGSSLAFPLDFGKFRKEMEAARREKGLPLI